MRKPVYIHTHTLWVQVQMDMGKDRVKIPMGYPCPSLHTIRVVHVSHFQAIFHSFSIHFHSIFHKIKTQNEKWSFFTFLAVCLVRKMHFRFIFLSFTSQGVYGNYFSHHFSFPFSFPFVYSPAKYMKMTWKWPENGPKMATMNNPI